MPAASRCLGRLNNSKAVGHTITDGFAAPHWFAPTRLPAAHPAARARPPDVPGGLNLSCFRFAMIGSCRVHLPVAIVFDWERGPTARTSVMKKKAKKKSKGT
jgi:hypothetical protein